MTRSAAATAMLGIEWPIVQGPFGGGLSTVALAAAVSDRGGLGSYGAHVLAPADIERVGRELHAATSKPFALNLWISVHDRGGESLDRAGFDRAWQVLEPYFRELGVDRPELPEAGHPAFDDQFDALIEVRPPVFSFVFGVPTTKQLQACRARGIATVGAATSVAEARALDHAGVDAIVATGFEAGGHRPSFLARAEDALMGTFVLTQLVKPRVAAPVIAAGGIADAIGANAALALGADAVQVGTAFLATQESGTTDDHRAALFAAESSRTTLTRAYTGRLARGIANRWVDEVTPQLAQLPPFPMLGWLVSKLRGASVAQHRTDLIALWCGQIAPNLEHRDAAALMDALIAGIESR